ncbi:hypothetical protein DD238_001476 [Peronospora effusa]|uniref:Uncharacterized protein n=1 Tax=Peronospora effusa TaxID=542832 RepID=A0A3M6VMR2_9STRA|nr:hypothetical protein DD238_001476 [Peronospora effusa]
MKTLCSQAFGAKDYNLLGKYVLRIRLLLTLALGTIVTAGVTDRLRAFNAAYHCCGFATQQNVQPTFLVVGLTHIQFRLPELRFVRCPKGTAVALFLRLVGYVVYMDLYRKFHHRCA